MPSYNKTIWKPKDVVTVEKLENIENGIFYNTLPNVTTEDNGKVLVVEDSQWVAKKVSNESGIVIIDTSDLITPSVGSLSANDYPLGYGYDDPNLGREIKYFDDASYSFIYNGDINKLIKSIPIFVADIGEYRYSIRPEVALVIETKSVEAIHREGYDDNALLITNNVIVVSLFFNEAVYDDATQINLIPSNANIETSYRWGPL